jgi:hypothetical protein
MQLYPLLLRRDSSMNYLLRYCSCLKILDADHSISRIRLGVLGRRLIYLIWSLISKISSKYIRILLRLQPEGGCAEEDWDN